MSNAQAAPVTENGVSSVPQDEIPGCKVFLYFYSTISTISYNLSQKVFAGNLAYTTTDEGLKAFFAPVQSDMYVALCTASSYISCPLLPALAPRLFYVALVQQVMVSLLLLQQRLLKRPSKFLTSKSSTVVRWSLRLPNRPNKKTGTGRRGNQRGDLAGVAAKPFQVKSRRQKPTATLLRLKILIQLRVTPPPNRKRKRSLLYVLFVYFIFYVSIFWHLLI